MQLNPRRPVIEFHGIPWNFSTQKNFHAIIDKHSYMESYEILQKKRWKYDPIMIKKTSKGIHETWGTLS